MILQTGGFVFAAISIKSSPTSCALLIASPSGTIPILSPSCPMSCTSEALILLLVFGPRSLGFLLY